MILFLNSLELLKIFTIIIKNVQKFTIWIILFLVHFLLMTSTKIYKWNFIKQEKTIDFETTNKKYFRHSFESLKFFSWKLV